MAIIVIHGKFIEETYFETLIITKKLFGNIKAKDKEDCAHVTVTRGKT